VAQRQGLEPSDGIGQPYPRGGLGLGSGLVRRQQQGFGPDPEGARDRSERGGRDAATAGFESADVLLRVADQVTELALGQAETASALCDALTDRLVDGTRGRNRTSDTTIFSHVDSGTIAEWVNL
jgi:hypothetical protein